MTTKQTVAIWGDFKEVLSHTLHVPQAALHVAIGLLLYPLFAWMLRERWGSWRPLIPIAALEFANEAVDFIRYFVSNWPWEAGNTVQDIALTLLPVGLVVLVIRRQRAIAEAARKAAQMPQ